MTDPLGVVSALVAAAGLGFSGWQLRMLVKDRELDRRLGVEGVCLSWRATVAPNQADVDADGMAEWLYVFRLDNPGRFPISDVQARVTFGSSVSRIRHGGVVDEPSTVLALQHPVLPGGANLEWPPRRLRMRFNPLQSRSGVWAEVSFLDSEGSSHRTRWPMVPRE